MAALAVCAAAPAHAWEARISGHPAMPRKFFAVDKDTQTLSLYRCKSPLKVIGSYPCTTGQHPGDKVVEGDLRTPEGVYFIKGRLHRTLDWGLYGNLAYDLNFPNPIDRIKGKTGYGIWVHGRGKKLVPRDTRGCVAMKTDDLRSMGGEMTPGLPVIISSHVTVAEGERADTSVLDQAVERVRAWAEAWQDRSEAFFSFYGAEDFNKAHGNSYDAFVRRKEGLFRSHSWIQVMVLDVRALPGPDYLVTYFKQYYRTPGLTSEGIKRLYWRRGEDGVLRIAGREWIQTPRTLDEEYLKRVASEVSPLIETWRAAWERGDMGSYLSLYARDASQGERSGVAAIKEQKAELWAGAPPARVTFGAASYGLDPMGVRVTFDQRYEASNGYSDHGLKELVMAPSDGGWKILSEDWRAL